MGTRSDAAATARPVTAPDFLLSRPSGSLRTIGATTLFDDPSRAARSLRQGDVDLVVGAIGFEPDAPAALCAPDVVTFTDGPLEPPAYFRQHAPPASVDSWEPSRDEHRSRVRDALAGIRGGSIDKVVLARALHLSCESGFDPHVVCARLIDGSSGADGFYVDLTAAGGDYTGQVLVGSSPELLVRRSGQIVECHPLAGSAPRSADPRADQAVARELRDSDKDIAEHRFVVDALVEALSPVCAELDVPDRPSLTATRDMWHLGTPLRGRLDDPAPSGLTTDGRSDHQPSALDLALLLHPTPAVGGTPTSAARNVIAGLEGHRGFYAGAVGWCDSRGDGEWMVSIRCAQISADRRTAITWAGGGIVADSDPDAELDETEAKFRTVLRALGAD